MLEKDPRISHCLSLLIKRAEENQGCLSYSDVVFIMSETCCEPSLDVLSLLYERITARGIQISEETMYLSTSCYKTSAHIDIEKYPGDSKDRVETVTRTKIRRKLHQAKRSQRYYEKEPEEVSEEKADLSPEDVIDELLYLASEGEISSGIFAGVCAKYRLLPAEMYEVADYLRYKGIDSLEIDSYLEKLFASNAVREVRYGIEDEKLATGMDYEFLRLFVKKYNRGLAMHIPTHFDHLFRVNSTTNSEAKRPPIPKEADHCFRTKPTNFAQLVGIGGRHHRNQ